MLRGFRERVTTAKKTMPKCNEASSMNTMEIKVMGRELKEAMLKFLVLNPPVAETLKAWQIASSHDIPAIL